MPEHREQSTSAGYFWPVVWAVALHVLLFGMLFVSFAFAPDLPPVLAAWIPNMVFTLVAFYIYRKAPK